VTTRYKVFIIIINNKCTTIAQKCSWPLTRKERDQRRKVSRGGVGFIWAHTPATKLQGARKIRRVYLS
jgi:hypothetical protein